MKRKKTDHSIGTYIRICQSCGNVQEAKDPTTYADQKTETWRDVKCRHCKSEDLDWGTTVCPQDDDA